MSDGRPFIPLRGLPSHRVIEAHGRAVADLLAALDTRTADERQRARLEQLAREYVADRITLEQLELETGRTLGLPDPPPPVPPGGVGPLVHVAVLVAGAAALVLRWRRPGTRWIL